MQPGPSEISCIAKRLMDLRGEYKMSQTQFCRHVGIAASTWNQYEHARQRISLDMAMRLCNVTGVTLDWIYLGDGRGMPLKFAHLARDNFYDA